MAIAAHTLPYQLRKDLVATLAELNRVLTPGGAHRADLLDLDDGELGRGLEVEENTFLDESGLPIQF